MKKRTKAAKPKRTILCVEILEAKPNPLFSEEQRAAIRFLRFNRRVECAECGKKVLIPWTALYAFRCGDMKKSTFYLQMSDKVHPPLTPVCGDHPLAPAFDGSIANGK